MQAAERDCLEATECVRSRRTYTMAKDRASGEYAGVTLIESATRGHNGRTCTVIKFVMPRALASRLNVCKGKEADMHLRGDRIVMLF